MGKTATITVQCCVCKRVRGLSGRFRKEAVPEGAKVSHTYCPACAAEARARIKLTNPRLKSEI